MLTPFRDDHSQQMRKEEQEADGIEVTWGEFHCNPLSERLSKELSVCLISEDQQHINTFSKYNARLGDLQDELKVRQVCEHRRFWNNISVSSPIYSFSS